MTQKSNRDGLRKAAILVFSLDRRTADLVLERMGPEQARQVRQAMVEMEAVDPKEQGQVLEEFRRRGPLAAEKYPPGIELDDRLARKLAAGTPGPAVEEPEPAAPKPPPFRFLRDAEIDKLVKVLAGERSQVVALVLSHLPPETAGNVLARLAPAVQADVIRRLVDLEETDPEILRDVERGLERRLSEQVRMQRRRVAGLAAVSAILQAAEPRVGMQILENLAQHDRRLVEKLSPGRFEFSDLMEADDDTLATTIAAADPELVVMALVGAPPEWLERFLGHLPDAEAQAVRQRLDHFGPIRLSDVDEARRRLAELARRLAIEGRIELPPTARAPVLT